MRRLFNAREKKILYMLADGKCQVCGDDLKRNWEADHITPFSKGGRTELRNGQALCKNCNIKKSNKIMAAGFNLRDWQKEALHAFLNSYQKKNTFLLVAGVGAGKTFWSCYAAHHLLTEENFDSIIIVSPTQNIKVNWQQILLKDFGIDIDYDFSFKYDWRAEFKGISITYQSLNEINSEWLKRRVNRSTLLIVDEVHHAGDTKSWGEGLRTIGEHCGFVLLLSGTPTRSDNSKIPFVQYEPIGQNQFRLKEDFYYGYAESVRDHVCCPVNFNKYAGKINTVGGTRLLSYDQDRNEARRTFNRCLDTIDNADFVLEMFEQADKQLSEINDRRGENYAGLIVCNSIADANKIHQSITSNPRYGPQFAEVVTSDDVDSNIKINEFKNSTCRWIVSVNMVSEGVDIPRIRTIVYATNFTTMLFFVQVIGRGVRNARHMENDMDTCHVYIPEYKPLVDNASIIEQQITHVIEEVERQIREGGRRGGGHRVIDIDDIVLSGEAISTGSIYSGNEITQDDKIRIESVARQNSVTVETALSMWAAFQGFQQNDQRAEISLVAPTTEIKKSLRKQIAKVVGQIVYKVDTLEHGEVHYSLNESVGVKRTDAMTRQQLERKLQLAIEWLNDIKRRRS